MDRFDKATERLKRRSAKALGLNEENELPSKRRDRSSASDNIPATVMDGGNTPLIKRDDRSSASGHTPAMPEGVDDDYAVKQTQESRDPESAPTTEPKSGNDAKRLVRFTQDEMDHMKIILAAEMLVTTASCFTKIDWEKMARQFNTHFEGTKFKIGTAYAPTKHYQTQKEDMPDLAWTNRTHMAEKTKFQPRKASALMEWVKVNEIRDVCDVRFPRASKSSDDTTPSVNDLATQSSPQTTTATPPLKKTVKFAKSGYPKGGLAEELGKR